MIERGNGETGARCAQHPMQSASGTCDRCGNFTCAECGPGAQCPPCAEREGHAFTLSRDAWTFSGLWDHAATTFKREWVMLSLATLVLMLTSFVLSAAGAVVQGLAQAAGGVSGAWTVQSVSFVVQNVVQGALMLGLVRMSLEALQGRKAELGQLFGQFRKVPRYFLMLLIVVVVAYVPIGALVGAGYVAHQQGLISDTGAAVAAGVLTLVLIGPLIYFGVPLSFAMIELAYDDRVGAVQALRNSYAIGQGQRLATVGVALVGAAVTFAGLMAFCIGILPAMGFAYLLFGGLYLALRNR